MKTFLALPDDRKRAAYEQTSAQRNLPASYVEKDLWVCWVLSELFTHPDLAPHLTFRGGTSLSKAFGIIQRFSEDIDLAISREWLGITPENDPAKAANPSQRRLLQQQLRHSARKKLEETIAPILQMALQSLALEEGTWSLALSDDENALETARDPYCLFLNYPCLTEVQTTDYIRSRVKIEFSARAEGTPEEEAQVASFVAEQYPAVFEQPSFSVTALSPERTFWEKCFIIHEENTASEERSLTPRLARHYYDLFCLLQNGNLAPSDELFKQVAKHRAIHFPRSWVNYKEMTPSQLQILPIEGKLQPWIKDYELMKSMFYGSFPSFEEATEVIQTFSQTHP